LFSISLHNWLVPLLTATDPFLVSWASRELRRALRGFDLPAYEIFGQGSRVNGTSIEQSSDIDLVLMVVEDGVRWEEFRDQVLAALGRTYAVRMGRRCLNVDEPDSLFGEMVDILVATSFEDGVFFRDDFGRPIVNFPQQHRVNGDFKDLATGGRFKEVVRTAKRARRRAGLSGEAVPSYLLECLLYNVPDEVYLGSSPFRSALSWLQRCSDLAGLPCQNGINRIFGPGPDQWEPGEAARILGVLQEI
jgi:hypothetical protein